MLAAHYILCSGVWRRAGRDRQAWPAPGSAQLSGIIYALENQSTPERQNLQNPTPQDLVSLSWTKAAISFHPFTPFSPVLKQSL